MECSYGQYHPKYECGYLGDLEKFRFYIFSFQTFNTLTPHINLTIFIIGNMHLGQTISKIKVVHTKCGYAVHESEVEMHIPLW